ncbi:MAG: amidohydrolase family protein, partial [Caulobacterales bacterium]
MRSLLIRNVEIDGRSSLDVRVEGGRIVEIGTALRDGPGRDLDGRGGALISGLVDHHIHLFALAAAMNSVALDGVSDFKSFSVRMMDAVASRAADSWVRVVGYHERMAGDLDRDVLDRIAPHCRVRVQHQTGSLWTLNSLAIEAVLGGEEPSGVERDANGRPTGRLWRADAWLNERIKAGPPPIAALGRALAAFGLTAVTDASVTTDPAIARLLADAVRTRALPLRLTLMSGQALEAPDDGAFAVGPVKVLLDDHNLPDIDAFIEKIAFARASRRAVAVHCVTETELALTLAAFEAAGPMMGDRIEHGSVIPQEAIARVRELGLMVVTQPAFMLERGDRYHQDIPEAQHPDLYRCATLVDAGIPVAFSSDAPYASPDPWRGIAAAAQRRTAGGAIFGGSERIS